VIIGRFAGCIFLFCFLEYAGQQILGKLSALTQIISFVRPRRWDGFVGSLNSVTEESQYLLNIFSGIIADV